MTQLTIKNKPGTKTLVLLYIKGELQGVLPAAALASLNINTHKMDAEQQQLLEKALFNYARQRLWAWLGKAERSSAQALAYLKRLPCAAHIAAAAVEDALERNFINDERFAELLLQNALAKGVGPQMLKHEFKKYGLGSSLLSKVLQQQDQDELEQQQQESLERCLQKALRRYGNQDYQKMRHKVLEYAWRKGFKVEQASQMLEKLLNK